jgi:hypothetical protein
VELLELLKRGEIAEERTGVWCARDAGKTWRLVIRPGIRDGAAGGSGVAESVGEMGEFVGDSVGLEIGDVEVGAIDGPLFEITTDDFGVVMMLGFVRSNRERGEEKRGKQTDGYSQKTEFHRTHLGAEKISDGESIDLYSGEGKSEFYLGK